MDKHSRKVAFRKEYDDLVKKFVANSGKTRGSVTWAENQLADKYELSIGAVRDRLGRKRR